jgi:hypothetical protein
MLYVFLFLLSSIFIIAKPDFFAGTDPQDWVEQLKTVSLLLAGVVLILNAQRRIRNQVTRGDALVADYGLVIFGLLAYDCLLYKFLVWHFFSF